MQLTSDEAAQGEHKILIVDDDRNLARLLATVLGLEGHAVLVANDGQAALDLLKTNSVDVIVLDLRMPGMDGRTVYRRLREEGVSTPVLIASAFGARSAQKELGAEGAIEKPFAPETLAKTVSELLTVNGS